MKVLHVPKLDDKKSDLPQMQMANAHYKKQSSITATTHAPIHDITTLRVE